MVQPTILHPNVQINDITTAFRAATSTLSPGQLVKDEHFTLFEAVSALEIGDPKMDSGCHPGEDAEEDYNFATPFSAHQLIWLMDELICREVAWHMGYPLSQTLFTSVHIERLLWPEPKSLDDASFVGRVPASTTLPPILTHIFQPFCLALIKCCDLVLTMVLNSHYYEEEDFATQVFNRPLLHAVAVDDILVALQSARTNLSTLSLAPDLEAAIAARLDLRLSFLSMLQSCADASMPDPVRVGNHRSIIELVQASSHLGKAATSEVFTLKIQRRLASSVPPRPMVVINHQESFKFLARLFTDSINAFELLKVSCSADLLVAYQAFMSQNPQPAVYVRALVQSFLSLDYNVLGRFTAQQFVFQDLQPLTAPDYVLTQDVTRVGESFNIEQSQIVNQMTEFAGRVGQSFINIFRTQCLSRSRLRRSMCHAALEWDQIQAEAEELDASYQSAFGESPRRIAGGEDQIFSFAFSSWVYHHKLCQLETIHQLGFELSIYAPYEYVQTLWHLAWLTNAHLSHLDRMSLFVASDGEMGLMWGRKTPPHLRQLFRHFTWLKAVEALAKALHGVFVVLQRHGHVRQPAPTYSTHVLRYELRMRPFQHLSIPEPLTAEVARQGYLLEGLSDQAVLDQASRNNQIARKTWDEVLKNRWHSQPLLGSPDGSADRSSSIIEKEWTQGMRNCIKACIGNGIAISVLANTLKNNQTTLSALKVTIPETDHRDRWHPSWPVPKISS